MATSGSVDYSETARSIIQDAYHDVGVIDNDQTPTQNQFESAKRRLNRLIKAWQAEGVWLGLQQEITVALAYGETYYDLGPTGDNASTTMVKTEIETAADSGDGTIDVDSITGISDGDYIGIELDDGTMQWTTVNGAPAGSTITLTAVLTDDVAVDNVVLAYTTKTHRPKRIIPDSVRLIDQSGNETPIRLVSQNEYKNMSDKDSTGQVNMVYYDPQLADGRLYTWPACDDVSTRLLMTIERPVYDMDDFTDDFDFPQEWYLALEYNLALLLAVPNKTDGDTFARIQGLAAYYYTQAKDFDRENVSTFFVPDLTGY